MNNSTLLSTPIIVPIPPNPTYLSYLNFGQSLVTALLQLVSDSWHNNPTIAVKVTIPADINLLYTFFFHPTRLTISIGQGGRIAPTICILIASHLLNSLAYLPYGIYVAGWRWRSYDADALFWTGLFINPYMIISPIAVFFLAVDRYLVLRARHMYSANWKKVVVGVEIVTLLLVTALSLWLLLIELPLKYQIVIYCENIACLTVKYRNLTLFYMKIIVGTLNLVVSCALLRELRRYNQGSTSSNVKNRAIKITIILEFCFNIVPSYIAGIYNTTMGKSLSTLIGQYPTTASALDMFLCSLFYSRVMLKKFSRRVYEESGTGTDASAGTAAGKAIVKGGANPQ